MDHRAHSNIMLGGLAVVAIVVVVAAVQFTSLGEAVRGLGQRTRTTMQTLSEVVTVGTRQITVTTTRGADESMDDWIARHNAAVQALQQ